MSRQRRTENDLRQASLKSKRTDAVKRVHERVKTPSDTKETKVNTVVIKNVSVVDDTDQLSNDDVQIKRIYARVFAGHFDGLPTPMSKLVRVFTSSTFTDTTTERNALMEDVYPALKEYCRETHGLDFQVVDMRWGVRDEATDDHMTTKLCINEIGNCQRLSMGPNFVMFLCQKYGYRPLPSELLSTELDLLKSTLLEEREDVSLLETWYIEDANTVPPLCILQPISSILPNFNNKRIPKLQEQDAMAWWENEEKMQMLLRKASRLCYEKGLLTQDQMHNYYMSVTEREVVNGVLKAKDPNEHCVCYVRHINNVNLAQTKTASKFVDITHNQVNIDAQKLLSNLRDERVPACLLETNIRRSTVEWAPRDGIETAFHAVYLKQFCEDFYKSITKMVNKAIAKFENYRDDLFGEVLQHLHNGQQVSSIFYGRNAELKSAECYVKSRSNLPFILQGDYGCGKTSLLALIATQTRGWLDEANGRSREPVVVLRFIGTSPDSSSIVPLLTSVCEQIARNYEDGNLIGQSPTEPSKLFLHFKRMVALADVNRPLVIIFDSLDLLSKVDGAHELLWFLSNLPPNVKFFVSITPGASSIGGTLRKIIEVESQYLQVPSLGVELAVDVITKWLKASGRTLTERQLEVVCKALNKCTLALFVKLVFATVSRWKSYSKPQETILSYSIQDSIHALFDRTESQHGKLLVSHALSYITAAKAGISDSELEDLISLDDKVLDDVYQYHLPPVRRIPPLLWSRIRADLPGYLSERSADGVIVLNWYHEQFKVASVERYFKNVSHQQGTHSALADYFLGTWSGTAKPFQYTEVQRQRFGIVDNEGQADRKVPKQPNIFPAKEGVKQRFNARKLNELPFHLVRAGRHEELLTLCLFDYDFVFAKVNTFPLQAVIGDYEEAISHVNDSEVKKQLNLIVDALRLSSSLLSRFPQMLGFELLGRLLPLVGDNSRVRSLLISCDIEGPKSNGFIPGHHCFHSPGGPLKYSMEEHQFAVFGMRLTSDQKSLVTISNQFIIWDVATGDLARVINPNIDGVFFGLSVSSDDKYAAAFTNNNLVIVTSLITGDFICIQPESLTEQMDIEQLIFTNSNAILIWSREQHFVYSIDGNLLWKGSVFDGTELAHVFYDGIDNVRFVKKATAEEEWKLSLSGCSRGQLLKSFDLMASMVFDDLHFTTGYACINDANAESSGDDDNERYCLVRIQLINSEFTVVETLMKDLPDCINLLQILKVPGDGDVCDSDWLIGISSEFFLLHQRQQPASAVVRLQLPAGVRNIPIKPMHSTTAVAIAADRNLFIAGIRRNLYLFDIIETKLLHVVDAHFGRILNILSVKLHGRNALLSSSIDHSIKMWNIENIFEKAYLLPMMEQPIQQISMAKNANSLAVIQTRKCVALWDTSSNRLITTLVASIHGAVVTHSLIDAYARLVICIESDNLLVWDLRTQSVQLRIPAPQVHQLFFLLQQTLIGVINRKVDMAGAKIACLNVYKVSDLTLHYTLEFPCRIFQSAAVMKGGDVIVIVVYKNGHDSLWVIDIEEKAVVHKFRPRATKKQQKEVMVQRIIAMPHNSHRLIVMEGEWRGAVWDIEDKRLLRHLQQFNGECTQNGKLGLHAPNRGGLHIIDMQTGAIVRTLIGQVNEGVNDVLAMFTPTGHHVLYYHNGQRMLRVFRVTDGCEIGNFRPHAQLTCWACHEKGQSVTIGSQDGSLLTGVIYDEKVYENSQTVLAHLPSRRHLATHLQIPVTDLPIGDTFDLKNLTSVTGAVAKFKQLIGEKSNSRSQACSVQ